MTDAHRSSATVPEGVSAFPHASYKRERIIYLVAPLLLLVNRGLVRFPHFVLPASVLEDQTSWYYTLGSAFSWLAIIYCIVATWRFFEFAGVSRWASIINGLISPLLFPLVLLPQAIYVLRKASKQHVRTEAT